MLRIAVPAHGGQRDHLLGAALPALGAADPQLGDLAVAVERDHGVDFYDGQVDVTHGADFITVSWNVFHDHFKNSLVGNSENTGDEDIGHLRITYHHNLFTRVDGRNPSIRFGTGHVYNNHYLNIPDYGIASRINAQVRVENNYFDNVETPIRADTSLSDVAGFVNQVNTNIFVNCGPNSITTPAGNTTYTATYQAPEPLDYYPLTPCRLVDTRPSSPLQPGVAANFTVAGTCGVPATAIMLVVNVTVVGPDNAGYVQVYGGGLAPPITSSINFAHQQLRSNNGLVGLGQGNGQISARSSTATVHLVVDVVGYFE